MRQPNRRLLHSGTRFDAAPLLERMAAVVESFVRSRQTPRGLVSLTVPLPRDAVLPPPASLSGCRFLAQPGRDFFLLGSGTAARLRTAGPGRFQAMADFMAGKARAWHRLDPLGTGMAPKAFLGFAFGAPRGPLGDPDPLPNAEVTVPGFLLQRRDGSSAATFTGRLSAPEDARRLAAKWMETARNTLEELARAPAPDDPAPKLRRIASDPDDAAWLARAARAVRDIRAGRLEKVVLSRRTRVAADIDLDPAAILTRLAARHPSCTLFAFGAGPMTAVGASPERLVALTDGFVQADALAGTLAGSGHSGAALLGSEKDGHEHRLVVDAMATALAPVCRDLDIPTEPRLLRLSALQHLWTPITGRAQPGVNLLDLVARLHPTPAVGGSPNRVAQDWLAREGETRLGWYTGGTGWISPDGDGEVSVVLRCAALNGNRAVLSAGAGIVAASDPEAELAETELKLGTMLDALGGA